MQITINAYYKLLKEEVRDEVDILHAEPQSFLQVDFNTLPIKVSYKVILTLLIVTLKVLKKKKVALSLQYHKIELGMAFIFSHTDKHQSSYKSALSFFMEVARHVQNTQKKLVMFLQFIKKKEETAFVFYCDAKHSHICRGSSHVTCFSVLLVSQ